MSLGLWKKHFSSSPSPAVPDSEPLPSPSSEKSNSSFFSSVWNRPRSETKTAQPKPAVKPTGRFPLKALLSKKGKLSVETENHSDVLDPLLKKTVCHDAMKYQSMLESEDRSRHCLLDKKGRLISLLSSVAGFVGITNSQNKPAWKASPTHRFMPGTSRIITPLEWAGEDAVRLKGERVVLPDNCLVEHLTDSTSDHNGRYRVHLKSLYSFNADADEWQLASRAGDKITLLKREASGEVWQVKNDKVLSPVNALPSSPSDLSEVTDVINDSGKPKPLKPELKFDRKIEHFTVSKDYQGLVQLNNDDDKLQRMVWLEDVRRPEERLDVTIAPGFSCRKSALFDNTVFAIDYRGVIQSCDFPSKENPVLGFNAEFPNRRARQINEQISRLLGPKTKIEDIGGVRDNRMNLVVRDRYDQRHFLTLKIDRDQAKIESAWNLSDCVTLDHQKGLMPLNPPPQEIMDLGRLGKITRFDNRPYFLNPQTGQWELSNEERAERLKLTTLRCGLDGKPWMLKDGQLKRLKVRLGTHKIIENGNVFVLPQAKKSLSTDLSVSGMDTDFNLTDFAVADAGHFITLNTEGGLNFHTSGTNRVMTPTRLKEQMAAVSDGHPVGKITSLAFNEDKELIMREEGGDIYILPEQGWVMGSLEELKRVTLNKPNGDPIVVSKLHTTAPGEITVEDNQAGLWRFVNEEWLAANDEPAHEFKPDAAYEAIRRLHEGESVHRIPGTRVNIHNHSHVLGMDPQSGSAKTRFKDRMKAFVFRPTLAWPRPLKTLAYGVQHRYKGRDGLKSIYDIHGDLSRQLNELENQTAPFQSQPLEIRLAELAAKGQTVEEKKLIADLKDLADMLTTSSQHFSGLIGHHYGILDRNFRPKNSIRKNNLIKLPLAMKGKNLSVLLNNALSSWPADTANSAGKLMAQLVERNIPLITQPEVVPNGRQRDTHDAISLVKSRFIHDTLTLKAIHELINQVETAMTSETDRQKQIADLTDAAASLRFEAWEQNPIKLVTDQGFYNHRTLEANYDAIRSMMKAFSKEHHGVNVTARSVLNAEDQKALEKNLTDTLLTLQPGESMSVSRTYGVSGQLSSYYSRAMFVGANAGANLNRGYQLAFQRTDDGFNVMFGRSGAVGGQLSFALLDNLMGDFDSAHPFYLDGDPHKAVSKTGLLGGGVTLSARSAKLNRVTFDVMDHEIPAFVEQLLADELNPLEILNRGGGHNVHTIRTMDINLSASASAQLYLTLPFLSDEVQDFSAIARARVGASAAVSLASAQRERAHIETAKGHGDVRSDNRVSFFDAAMAGLQFTAHLGPRVMDVGESNNVTAYVVPSIDAVVSINNRVNHKMKVEFSDANEVSTPDIDSIISKLEKHFTDNDSAQLLVGFQKHRLKSEAISNDHKLKALNDHFSAWYEQGTSPAPSADRYHELTGHGQKDTLLLLQNLVRRQAAFREQKQIIRKAEYVSTYRNLSRLDTNSLFDVIANLTNIEGRDTNADRIRNMMEGDQGLQDFVNQLRENPHAQASVVLELNTNARTKLEQDWQNESVDENRIFNLLKDRKNVRIRALQFSQTVSKSDGFASPNFVIGGSNGAEVALTENLGQIGFTYSDEDDRHPVSYQLKGRIALEENEITQAMQAAQALGFVLKTIA